MLPIIYKHSLKRAWDSFSVGFLSSLLGVFMVVLESNVGIVFIGIGISFIIKALFKFNLYKTQKSTHLKISKKKLSECESDFRSASFEFTKNSLKYIDKLRAVDIKWSAFKNYKIVASNLFLILEQEKGEILAIGQKEIGNEDFEKVIAFVKTKVNA